MFITISPSEDRTWAACRIAQPSTADRYRNVYWAMQFILYVSLLPMLFWWTTKKCRSIRLCHNVRNCTFWHICPYMPNEDSDQPAHSRSLFRICPRRILDNKGCKVSSCGQRRLIRLRGCAVWSESSLGAHVRRYVFSRCGSFSPRVC